MSQGSLLQEQLCFQTGLHWNPPGSSFGSSPWAREVSRLGFASLGASLGALPCTQHPRTGFVVQSPQDGGCSEFDSIVVMEMRISLFITQCWLGVRKATFYGCYLHWKGSETNPSLVGFHGNFHKSPGLEDGGL